MPTYLDILLEKSLVEGLELDDTNYVKNDVA
jgi:hypothetical protein